MKILHINTYDTGGAATACRRIHLGLLERGIDSKVLYLKKTKDVKETYQFLIPKSSLFLRIKNKITKKDYIIISLIIVFVIAIYPTIEHMVYFYITNTQMNSSGALIRVSMSAAAAIVFFIFKKRWEIAYKDSNLWNLFSIFVLLLLPLVFVVSTAVDRIALYLLPMQIVIFTRACVLITESNTRYFLIPFIFKNVRTVSS